VNVSDTHECIKQADVYQYSVMLNACTDSWAAGKLMDRMERAGVQPSEVTFQKLYKIFLRDARVKEAGAYEYYMFLFCKTTCFLRTKTA
jgi:hypothetical protein